MTDNDIHQKECFERFYTEFYNKMSISDVTETFFNEKGYFLNRVSEDLNKNPINEEENNSKTKPNFNLMKDLEDLEKEIEEITKKYSLDNDDLYAPEQNYLLNDSFKDGLYDRESYIASQKAYGDKKFVASPLKEPNIKEGVRYAKFKYDKFKSEKKL